MKSVQNTDSILFKVFEILEEEGLPFCIALEPGFVEIWETNPKTVEFMQRIFRQAKAVKIGESQAVSLKIPVEVREPNPKPKTNKHGIPVLDFLHTNSRDAHCYYCGAKLTRATATTDHVIPMSKGGSNRKENRVPACRSCNHTKSDFYVEEFRDWLQIGLKQPICFYGENNGEEYLLIRPFIEASNNRKKENRSCRFCGRPVTITDFNKSHLECAKEAFRQKK